MNKKERERLEALERELRIARAFKFTDRVDPDIEPPKEFGRLAKGYLFNASLTNYRVEPACTDSVHHAFGQSDRTTTQRAAHLYSTRLLALRAMRSEIERKCAEILADIDKQIENESEAK